MPVKLHLLAQYYSHNHNSGTGVIKNLSTGTCLGDTLSEEILSYLTTRDGPILLFFSPIFLSGNSFFSNLSCSIFCSKFQHFAQSLAK